jgi:polyisoprenoid-binding protein YceI
MPKFEVVKMMTTRVKILAVLMIGALGLATLILARQSRATALGWPDDLNPQANASSRFTLDPGQSKFIAHALRGGLFWFKGHEHLVAAREFTGEARMTPDSITAASLRLTVRTDSMVETSDAFTEPQKQIINKELREIVLEPAKYPEIVFKSTEVKGKLLGAGQYDLQIRGALTLHGVTRQIEIPAKLTITGNDLRAVGEFSIDRSDFNVKATSAFHGMVRVRKKVKFTFDIVGHRM